MDDSKSDKENEIEAKKAFRQIFEEMVDLLQLTVEKVDKQPSNEIPKDLEEKLAALERDVNEFCAMNQVTVDKKKGHQRGDDPLGNLSLEEKSLYHRSKDLQEEADKKIADLEAKLKRTQASGKVPSYGAEDNINKKLKRIKRQKGWERL